MDWLEGLGDSTVWMDGVAARKITDFAGAADAGDAPALRDCAPVKRLALIACLVHKARMRVRDDLATRFCKRVATKIKKAKTKLEEIRLAEREITETLIGNYRVVLKGIDGNGPAQAALAKAAKMTAGTRAALEGLNEEAPAEEVVRQLGGKDSPALLAFVKAVLVQAGGLATLTRTVEGFDGSARQYEQIEKVSAHHGNLWEPLLCGQIGRDRAVMFDLAGKLEFTATSEDGRVLDALAHAKRHQSARGEYITAFDEEGLVLAPETGIPSLKPPRRTGTSPSCCSTRPSPTCSTRVRARGLRARPTADGALAQAKRLCRPSPIPHPRRDLRARPGRRRAWPGTA
ncbi:hypothetical protein ACWEQ8_28345 [Streptomyces noursei]